MRIDRRTFLSMAVAAATAPALASRNAVSGRTETLAPTGRGGGPESRVRVWLPPSYGKTDRPHQTLYMLDGGEDAGFVTGSTLSINGGQHMY